MINLCNKSIRLISLVPMNSLISRQFCTNCANKQNLLKSNAISKCLFMVCSQRISTSSTLCRFQTDLQCFGPKRHLWTTFGRNQKLNSINRNAVKDKNSKNGREEVNEWQQLKQMSLTKKLKFMFTKYWYISIPVHCVTSCLWFGVLYLTAKSGFDVKPILDMIKPYAERLPLPEFVQKMLESDTNASSAGYVAIALILYKLLFPARYATTVGVSYYSINFFVKRGLIKPVPSGQQIKAQVIRSRSKLNSVLRERIAKREELRKRSKNKKHK